MSRIASEASAVARYQAVLRVRGRGPEGRFRATQVVIFERPDRIRVELLGAFGRTRWVAVASSGEITVLFPGRDEYLKESQVEPVVGALLGVPFSADEVIALLSGSALPLALAQVVSAHRQGSLTHLSLADAEIEVLNGQVSRARNADFSVAYPTLWKRAKRPVPEHIELSSEQLEASIVVEDLDVNISLHPEAFLVDVPEGANRLRTAEVDGQAIFVPVKR